MAMPPACSAPCEEGTPGGRDHAARAGRDEFTLDPNPPNSRLVPKRNATHREEACHTWLHHEESRNSCIINAQDTTERSNFKCDLGTRFANSGEIGPCLRQ